MLAERETRSRSRHLSNRQSRFADALLRRPTRDTRPAAPPTNGDAAPAASANADREVLSDELIRRAPSPVASDRRRLPAFPRCIRKPESERYESSRLETQSRG